MICALSAIIVLLLETYEPAHEIIVLITLSLCCSHTWSMEIDEVSDQKLDIWSHWMAVHARSMNEFMEDEKCHNHIWSNNVTSWPWHDEWIILPEDDCNIWLWHFLEIFSFLVTWAMTWQNQQSDCAPSEDSDHPGHPPRVIAVCSMGS